MDKALKFVHSISGEVFYFERITTRLNSMTKQRVVVAVGIWQSGMDRKELNADILFGEKSLWKFAGGKVWEG